jgi:hypothetical protein
MKRNRKSKDVVATLLLATLFCTTTAPISEAANKPKAAGRTSSTIPNTILNGKGAPLNTLGINGDFYIDTRSLLIYGPKQGNKWPLPQSLQGPTGVPGADGKNGSEGKTISNASTVAGPSGAQGEKGEKGDKGESGPAGASGAPGAPGAIGLTGAKGDTGATGPSGGGGGTPGPTGATGATGLQGLQGPIGLAGAKGETGTAGTNGAAGAAGATGSTGATGLQGSIGATGAKGDTGLTGAIGPSNVYINSIPVWNLSTSTARTYSTSSTFLNFKSGKNYIYSIYLYGQSDASGGVFAIEILHSDGSTSRFGYSAVENTNFSTEAKLVRYTFTITGVISPIGGDVRIAIRVIDDLGITGSSNAMAFSGIAFSTLVGEVGAL